MDEYIEQLLAEMQAPAVLQDVVRNILDAPIPEAVKKRLLKPLLPEAYRPIPSPRKAREKKRKVITEEFDPVVKQPKTIQDYQKDILDHPLEQEGLVFRTTPWNIGNFLRGWQMDVPRGHPLDADPLSFLEGVRPQIRQKLTEEILALKGIKFQLALKINLRQVRPDGSEETGCMTLRRKQEALLQAAGTAEINEVLDTIFPYLLEVLEKKNQRGSGWMVDYVNTLWLDIARYQPLRGGSYIPLPAVVENKHAVINVNNTDDRCLEWTIIAAKFKVVKDPQRPTSYPNKGRPVSVGIDTPTPISQISKVEKQTDLAINVFGWDGARVIIYRLSERACASVHNVLLIEKAGKFHYTWIKDLNRLLYDQSKHRERKHFCERCLHGYSRKYLLEAHKPDCRGIGQTAVRVEMPSAGENKLTFQNHHKQFPAPSSSTPTSKLSQ